GAGLHTDDGADVEGLVVGRARVGERRLQPGDDLDEDRADALVPLLDVDARGRDALAEEELLRALERVEAGGAFGEGAAAGHAVVLLVLPAVVVLLGVARALVGAGEPGADHDAGGAGREVQRDVAWVAHAAVGPDVLAVPARLASADQDRRERRAAGAGLHARRTHRARADVDLHDVGPGVDEVLRPHGGA